MVFLGEGTLYLPKQVVDTRYGDIFSIIAEEVFGRIPEPYDRAEIIFDDSLPEIEEKLDSFKAAGELETLPRIVVDPRRTGEMTARFSSGRYETEIELTVRGYYLQPWARRSFEPNQSITAADVTVKEIPASQKGYGSITPAEISRGYVASRGITEGEKLTRYNTRKRIDVRAGEEITLIASSGSIEMKLAATARESGRIGEIIGVKPRNGEKSIRARIVSPREVVIEEL